MATRSRQTFSINTDPNIVPFIDVLLVLLVIFMVTAPKPTTDLRVDLPRENPSAAPLIIATIVELRQTPAGFSIFLGGQQVGFAALAAQALSQAMIVNDIDDARRALSGAPVIVRADQDIAYANVVAVIEALQHARFRKVSVTAAPDGSDRASVIGLARA
ncbi:MAG TPA: hypothetical protein DHW63_08800 [Hyphomonadaceae bacterium]|nr:hypothetical protein [Hyphomonadaceae bacterium]